MSLFKIYLFLLLKYSWHTKFSWLPYFISGCLYLLIPFHLFLEMNLNAALLVGICERKIYRHGILRMRDIHPPTVFLSRFHLPLESNPAFIISRRCLVLNPPKQENTSTQNLSSQSHNVPQLSNKEPSRFINIYQNMEFKWKFHQKQRIPWREKGYLNILTLDPLRSDMEHVDTSQASPHFALKVPMRVPNLFHLYPLVQVAHSGTAPSQSGLEQLASPLDILSQKSNDL